MTIPNAQPTPPGTSGGGDDLEITFVTEGHIEDAARLRAEEVMRDLATKAPRPVIFARVKLREEPARPIEDRYIAQGTIDVSGTLLRAQVSESNMIMAINTLGNRLERRLRDLRERRESANARPPSTEEGSWRSGDLPSARPGYFPRPREEREIVRRKTWAGDRISIAEAVFDLHALDHRFFLFTDEVDGVDSIVYETDEGGVRLRRLTGGRPPEGERDDLSIEIVESPAPELSTEEARDRLDSTNAAFVFYRDPETARGTALYRRYDGHYGLIEPHD